MECPKCYSHKTHKYGHKIGKQRYKCNECERQFLEAKTERGYDKKTIPIRVGIVRIFVPFFLLPVPCSLFPLV